MERKQIINVPKEQGKDRQAWKKLTDLLDLRFIFHFRLYGPER